MGIPFYYKHLIIKEQKKLLVNIHDCDRLFLDFNSIIHTCVGEVISKYTDSLDKLEINIFKAIFKHTIYITEICKPKQLLYIGLI